MKWKRKVWTPMRFWVLWALGLGMMMSIASLAEMANPPGSQPAAIATTTVADTVYRADGTPATGTVLISWPAFSTASGANVPAGSTSVAIGANGLLSVPLAANAGSTPMGSYYTVVYHLDDGSVTREYWVVPVSVAGGAAVKVSAIRSTVLPASVALQTVSKSYVDTAIAAAVTGHPLDSSPYVVKSGDTMTGPLNLPGDPTAPLQASDKNYVDTQVAGLSAGLGQKVSTMPQSTQVVSQPTGTELAVNRLNGVEYASQYVSGAGNNGIANATASPDCDNGCDVVAEQTYASSEAAQITTWNNKTQVEDHRGGVHQESFLNPLNPDNSGDNGGVLLNVDSTQQTAEIHALTGSGAIGSATLVLNNQALAGGSNVFPQLLQGTVPYFKTTYSTLNMTSDNYTVGQHVLVPESQNCYGVGDCLMGGMFMTSSGGFRDDADEGAHPFDLQFTEDTKVFMGTCSTGCTQGSTVVQVNVTAGGGTEGEGRYLLDAAPAHVIANGSLIGGSVGGRQPSAAFQGTNFTLSTLLETAQTVTTQASQIAPGTVTIPIVTSGAPAGFATNTAALPTPAGVACIADQQGTDGRPLNFETAAYVVVDGSHIQMTLNRPHAIGATIAVGGLCGYGLEQQADTVGAIRQVFPVVASTSPTSLVYSANGQAAIVGIPFLQSAFTNINLVIASIARTGGVTTVTIAGAFPADVNGLTLTVQGVADSSYNGRFVVTTTANNTLTYANSGPDSTSSGGTLTVLSGGYTLSPMAEVINVYNTTTKAVDGQMTLAANTVPWAQGDPVEEPHYFQQSVAADMEFITQYSPRPSTTHIAGITYQGNNGPGLDGWEILNATPVTNYFGNGGTHAVPTKGMDVEGVWRNSMEMEAGENAAIQVHCNSHGCDKWNSGYDLFQMDTSAGVDRMNYSPAISNLIFNLRGTSYQFTPTSFFAASITVGALTANTVNGRFIGTVAPASLPLFGASGAAHSVGAVPDPGANAGSTRFLREDGTWAAVSGGTTTSGSTTTQTLVAQTLANLPERSNLLGEHLLTEGTGTVAHDSSGKGNDAPITGAAWEGAVDLNFPTTGAFYQLPTAENQTNTWMFALYSAPVGNAVAPLPPGYGAISNFGGNPSILCGSTQQLTCFIATSFYGPKSHRLLAFGGGDLTESSETLTAGVHIVTIVCGDGGANLTHYYYDGNEVGAYITQGNASCNHTASGNYQIGGSTAFGGTWFTGKMAGDWEWATRLGPGEVQAASRMVRQFIDSKGFGGYARPAVRTSPVLIAGLDSRTAGAGNPAGGDWVSLTQLADSTFSKVNVAVSGSTAFDHCAMFETLYQPLISPLGGQVIVSLWGGVNDGGQTARQRADSLKCLVRKSKAAGARVMLATEISNSVQEAVSKDGLDTILRAEAYSWGVDNLVDMATNPTLGADNAYTNASCFPDGLHPGPNCEPLIAAMQSNAVNELIGSTESNRHTSAAASYTETPGDRFLDLNGSAAQTVALPACAGYTLRREVLNVGTSTATVTTSETLLGSNSILPGTKASFLAIPGTLAASGCHWERTQ